MGYFEKPADWDQTVFQAACKYMLIHEACDT